MTDDRNNLPEGVRVPSGGWMRLEDFCNTGPVGYPMYLTSGILLADEELLAVELGDRVGNAVLEQVVEGWNPLFDLALASDETGTHTQEIT